MNTVLNIPIGLQEMALAIWLLAKGFDRTALTSSAGSKVSLPGAAIITELNRSAVASSAESVA